MSSHLPHINKNQTGYKNRKPEKVADLEAEDRRRMELYRIYGKQEPGPLDTPAAKAYRGRIK